MNPYSIVDIINRLASHYDIKNLLDIYPQNAETLDALCVEAKIAVHPRMRHETFASCKKTITFRASVADFVEFGMHESRAKEFLRQECPAFDCIHINHVFDYTQVIDFFKLCKSVSHENTIWIIDHTVPNDAYSTVYGKFGARYRHAAGLQPAPSAGNVYKAIPIIHDEYQEFSYCTILEEQIASTVLWRSRTPAQRERIFQSIHDAACMDYFDMLKLAPYYVPLKENMLFSVIGKTLNPIEYAEPHTWTKLVRKLTLEVPV